MLLSSRPSPKLIAVAWLVVLSVLVSAQPPNPPYLAGMPSADTVKREIRGSNPADTLARQVAVFTGLDRIVQRMRLDPSRRSALTPGEQQLLNAYSLASYELSQGYLKSASPEAGKSFQQAVARYEFDAALSEQTFALLAPAARAEFERVYGASNAQAKARIEQQRRDNEPPRPQPPSAGGGFTGINSPGGAALRRCLELGGSNAECLGQGFMTDLGVGEIDAIIGQPKPTGLRVGGTYSAAAGLAVAFTGANASLSGCGKLQPDTRGYSVTRRGGQLQVEIQNKPTPLVIALAPDGRFTGPASFAVTGNVIAGYRRMWVESFRDDGTLVPGSGREESVPIYETRTERCGFASLRATAPAREEVGLLGMLTGGLDGSVASQRSATVEAPAGLRMSGKYAGAGGLQVEFSTTAAVIDCGEAHVMGPYTVENLAAGVVVTVRNGNAPLALTVRPDGSLSGSGTTEVAGRIVTGTNDSGATFAPRTTRCAVGVLTTQAQ